MENRTLFIVAGRFGKTLVRAKILPIISLNYFNNIVVFSEVEGYPLPDVRYITVQNRLIIKISNRIKFLKLLFEAYQLFYYSLKLKPDVINSYQLVPKAWYTVLVCKLMKIRSIVSSVGGIPEITTYLRPNRFWEKINLLALKQADSITTKGDKVTNYIVERGIQRSKIFHFNGAIELVEFNSDNINIRDIDIIFIGGFSRLKGPDRFIKIVNAIKQKRQNINAVLVGDGILMDEIRKMVQRFNLNQTVKLVGHVDNVSQYLRRSNILIMPSKSEGLATSLLEAMACGCVPIVSDVGCMTEAAKNKVNALVIKDYNDLHSFSTATLNLLKDEQLRSQLALNGTQFVKNNYSDKSQSQIYSQVLKYLFSKC